MMMEGEIPEALKPMSWLVGTWECSDGIGFFPTIKDFRYKDVVEFRLCGPQPSLAYSAWSSHPEKGNPMHLESGFLRSRGNGNVSFMIAHNFGLTSLEEGKVNGNVIEVQSSNIGRMEGSKDPSVTKVKRTFTLVDQNKIEFKLWMATSTQPELTEHLKATYSRKM